jgi:hypothetical protein
MKILSFDVGIVNLAYCVVEKIEDVPKLCYWEIITLENKSKFSAHISTSGVGELYINLIKALDERPHLLDVDIVLIEKQPSFNPKMRIIAGCLQTYFYIRGVIDRTENVIRSVEFFSPKNKLKCYDGPQLDITSKSGKLVKGKYAQTKKMGIAIARTKLEEYDEPQTILTFFENNKKKDDLSDCYLQALTYLTFKNHPKNEKKSKKSVLTKMELKKQLKEFLDKHIKVCSVIELMNKDFKNVDELELPEPFKQNDVSLTDLLIKYNMKKYINLNYK